MSEQQPAANANEAPAAAESKQEEKKGEEQPSQQPSEEKSKEKDDHLNLKVKSSDGNEIFFKVKKSTQFRKVMSAYCKKVGAEQDTVRFLFDGKRVRPESTPEELGMEDEDEVDAMVEQTGGAPSL
eukprot:TRINITY_DN373_c0_g3_i1.p1 TRINITY_DN373_c0_g3~~TRINITY_DN373_c0_g3_i1.p1  ORF type:complete len:126 (-),score=50.65 TRINITY_DN373_c0_g3_i1:402-779(-)